MTKRFRPGWVIALAVVLMPTASQPAEHDSWKPKIPIVETGLAPGTVGNFDCWRARSPVSVYARPGSTVAISRFRYPDTVKVMQTELHTWPQPVTVVFPHPPLQKNEVFYILAEEEEGNRPVWFRGKIDNEWDIAGELLRQAERHCKKPSSDCWLRQGRPEHHVWWIKVQRPDGSTGWINRPFSFYGVDTKQCSDSPAPRTRWR